MIEIISDKNVKTRKAHRCFLCNRKFEAGSEMNVQVNKYDDINRVYSCQTCKELMSGNWIEPNDENMFEQDTLSEYMYGDKFSGTPEEYLHFKKQKHALKIKHQAECNHINVFPDWQYGRTHDRCKSCEKLIKRKI